VRSTIAEPSGEMSPAVTSCATPRLSVATFVNAGSLESRPPGLRYTADAPDSSFVTMKRSCDAGSTNIASASCAPSG
jgi:hypothetical protein